jgi:hypothetical protein
MKEKGGWGGEGGVGTGECFHHHPLTNMGTEHNEDNESIHVLFVSGMEWNGTNGVLKTSLFTKKTIEIIYLKINYQVEE